MPTWLFNPCAPHDDPIKAGQQQNGSPCGNCVNVPRCWKVTGAGVPTTSVPGSGTFQITDWHDDGYVNGGRRGRT